MASRPNDTVLPVVWVFFGWAASGAVLAAQRDLGAGWLWTATAGALLVATVVALCRRIFATTTKEDQHV